MNGNEIEIPVPWGIIAGKTWGNEENSKILLVPGLGDNVESFNALVPLLPRHFCYVSVDLPGHGKSSHFPPNVIFNIWDYILAIRLVIGFLEEEPIILMGHSFGGCVLTLYTLFYPSQVSKLILIDSKYYPIKREVFPKTFNAYMEGSSELLTSLSTAQPQTFRYNEGLNTSNGKRLLGNKSSEELDKRNIVQIGADMYQSRNDPRLKYVAYIFITDISFINIFKSCPSICPTLSIIALDAKLPYYPGKGIAAAMEQVNPNYVSKFVRGDHYIHIHSPEIIAPLIIHFLRLKCCL